MDSAYSAVIFDLFGTLVPAYRHHEVLTEMSLALGLDPEAFIPAFALEARDARETGEVTLAQNLRDVCERLGHATSGAQIEKAVDVRRRFTRASLSPRPDALQVLSSLRANDYAIGLISDCCEVVSELWEATTLSPCIDAAILSFRVGTKKPARRIYDLACAALSVQPSRCLYVGDGGSNELGGAVEAGMDAVLLAVEAEVDLDPYRPEAREWTGPSIDSLSDLLQIVSAGRVQPATT